MQPITNSLINSLRKSSKFLHRDFLELEVLQKNSVRNEEFCKKSYFKLKTLLAEELQKHTTNLFFPGDKFNESSDYESVFLINPLDSPNNFARGISLFAISVTYLKQHLDVLTPITTVIYFPALNEIYYAEKGKGAWVEKNNLGANYQGLRLRVSENADLENCLTIIETSNDQINQKISNIRKFGSSCYAAILLSSGKADLIYLPLLNFTLSYAIELLITESGGLIPDLNKKFIYSNRYIAKQFKKY